MRCRLDTRRPGVFDRRECRQVEAWVTLFQCLQGAENLCEGNTAGRRRWHAAHLPAFVISAQRRAFLGGVTGEVTQRQAARIGMTLNLGDDFLRNRAFVKRVRTFFGDAFQHGSQRRVFQAGADGFGATVGIQEVGNHFR